MSVLIFCPLNRFEKETARAVFEVKTDCPTNYLFIRESPFQEDKYNRWLALEKARRYASNEGFQYLLIIGSGILPNRDLFLKLKAHQKPVASGTYFLNGTCLIAAFFLSEKGKYESYTKHPKLREFIGSAFPVDAVDFGSLLISREVFSFQSFEDDNISYCQALQRKGIRPFWHTMAFSSCIDKDGKVYRPEYSEILRKRDIYWQT